MHTGNGYNFQRQYVTTVVLFFNLQQSLLDMMDPEALVVFTQMYDIGDQKMKPQWSLAMYLNYLDEKR